jgi:hypothetical protein
MLPSNIVVLGDFCPTGFESPKIRPLMSLRHHLSGCFKTLANLECPVTSCEDGLPYKWANLKASPESAVMLEGLDVAGLANNHISDFGKAGADDSISQLRSLNIPHAGYGETLAEALKPAFVKLAGGTLGVVALSCPTTNGENLATHTSAGVPPLGMATLEQAIKAARPHCDAVIAYLHWGCEWVHDPVIEQMQLARHAIRCGADAVIGCHSHTIQSFEQYRGRWIFYGLGNYLFGPGVSTGVLPDGTSVTRPLRSEPANRESLAVSFSIQPDQGGGRLQLDQLQALKYGDDWLHQPVPLDQLSFSLSEANSRLAKYAKRHALRLESADEPQLISAVRNGVMAYWYGHPPIDVASLETRGRIMRTVEKLRAKGRSLKSSFSRL